MLVLVTGGSGSGKSALAEKLAVWLTQGKFKQPVHDRKAALFYIATMLHGNDPENIKKIKRHLKQRAGHGFTTLEQAFDLSRLLQNQEISQATVLLECLSNLLANEMFLREQNGLDPYNFAKAVNAVSQAIKGLQKKVKHLVIVSNEIFGDAFLVDENSQVYLEGLGSLNREIASNADLAVEVVYGLLVPHKGAKFLPKEFL